MSGYEIRFLKDIDVAKKGEIVETNKKTAEEYVKRKYAEYTDTKEKTTDEIDKKIADGKVRFIKRIAYLYPEGPRGLDDGSIYHIGDEALESVIKSETGHTADYYWERGELIYLSGPKRNKTKKKQVVENIKENINKPEGLLENICLEPVLNNDKPYWLANSGKTKIINDNVNGRTVKQILKENNPIEKQPIYELKSEGIWQCQKCYAQIKSVPDPPTECYKDAGGCGRTSTFKPITPVITGDIENLWKLPKWIDIPQENLDMLEIFDTMMNLSKQCLIFPEEELYKIFNLSIISSYHIDIWESIGFLLFIGLHDSGKTRALDYISELGYRIVHGGSGVTFPAMVRASHFYTAGILIDQAEKKLSERTETGRELLGFVLPSYRRRSKYVVAHKEDQRKTIAYKNFGFKAFGAERGLNQALFSRCIPFHMERDYPEIAKLSTVQDELNEIQINLINYKYKFNKPTELDNGFELKGRIREIFEPIIATGKHIGVDVTDILKFAKDIETEKEEELQGTQEWEILNVIKGEEENEKLFDAPEEILFKDICEKIGWEHDRKTGQKLGYIFKKKLFLKTKTKRNGAVLLLSDPKNSRKLKYLYKRYNV